MSKNLENEYKDLMNKEIPDLWARIESSLPEKNNKVSEKIAENISSRSDRNIGAIPNKSVIEYNRGRKKKKWYKNPKVLSICGAAAAAVLAIAIMLPTLVSTKKADELDQGERNKNRAMSAKSESSVEKNDEKKAYVDFAPEYEEGAAGEAPNYDNAAKSDEMVQDTLSEHESEDMQVDGEELNDIEDNPFIDDNTFVTNFKVVGIDGGKYKCQVSYSYGSLCYGDLILLESDIDLEIGEEYTEMLILDYMEDGIWNCVYNSGI